MTVATIAIGGNMILQKGDKGSFEDQAERLRYTAKILADFIEEGVDLVITHGNGPQVGNLLLQNERGKLDVPAQPLSILDAMTQGQIGVMIEQALRNELRSRGIQKEIAVVPTLVEVDKNDPAFNSPSKPIGPYYDEATAKKLEAEGKGIFKEDAGRGYRRVVPSPMPKRIIEMSAIKQLLGQGMIVIAVGGGGVPVILDENHDLQFVDAVIDKDRASQVLANELGSDELIILTDVSNAFIHYNTPEQEEIGEIHVAELRKHYENGEFAKGSMAPKIEAVMTFIEKGGKLGIITNPTNALQALHGKAGTRVHH